MKYSARVHHFSNGWVSRIIIYCSNGIRVTITNNRHDISTKVGISKLLDSDYRLTLNSMKSHLRDRIYVSNTKKSFLEYIKKYVYEDDLELLIAEAADNNEKIKAALQEELKNKLPI